MGVKIAVSGKQAYLGDPVPRIARITIAAVGSILCLLNFANSDTSDQGSHNTSGAVLMVGRVFTFNVHIVLGTNYKLLGIGRRVDRRARDTHLEVLPIGPRRR